MRNLTITEEDVLKACIENWKRNEDEEDKKGYYCSTHDLGLDEKYNRFSVENAIESLRKKGYFQPKLPLLGAGYEEQLATKAFDYFENKENKRNMTQSTVNNFYGNLGNIQIQQNTQGSTQSMKIEKEFDYDGALKIFQDILCNIESFNLEDEDKIKLKDIAIEAQQFSESKTNDSNIKKALSIVKDIMLRTSSSLTANGILRLIDLFRN